MHEDDSLSSWLREDEEGKVEEKGRFRSGAKQGQHKSGKRQVEGEKEAGEFESVRIRLKSLSLPAVTERSSEVLFLGR